MKTIVTVLIASMIFLSGCCLKFSDLPAGSTYSVGNVVTTSDTNIVVDQFQWGNGNWTSSGSLKIDTRNYSGGSGNDLNANNVNLRFLFDYPVQEIKVKFAELGGNNNIKINSDFRNVADITSLDQATIGGVHVSVQAVQQGNNWYGEIKLAGEIHNFSIGGQELWLDNVCPKK